MPPWTIKSGTILWKEVVLKYPVFVKNKKLDLCNGVSLYNLIFMSPNLVLKRMIDSLFSFPYAFKNVTVLVLLMVSVSFFTIFLTTFLETFFSTILVVFI